MNEHANSLRSADPKTFLTYEKGRTRIRRIIELSDNCEAHVEILHYSCYSFVDICITKQDMYVPAFNARLSGNGHRQSCESLVNAHLRSSAFRELHEKFDELCIPREDEKLFAVLDEESAGGAV